MALVLVGINHKTAPVEIREKIAFPEEDIQPALRRLQDEYGFREGLILSTCNRVEVYADAADSPESAVQRLKEFVYRYHSIEHSYLQDCLYTYGDNELILHVFRVASSLDSLVQGESQILGQMKQAYLTSQRTGTSGAELSRLMPRAFFVAKRVRTETRIANSPVSVSSVAVELARKIFDQLEEKSILLLGAGKMGELATKSLLGSGAMTLRIANRTREKAEEMAAYFGGLAVPYEDLEESLVVSDIILVSTGAASFVLDREVLERVIRKRRYSPLFIIDISVPRNVDPDVNNIDNIFLFDIDDLQSVIDSNVKERQREAELAEEIVRQEVQNFALVRAAQDVGPLISSLRERIEQICLAELNANRNGFDPGEYERIEKMMRKVARRIAHPLMLQIRRSGVDPDCRDKSLKMIKKAFELDVQE